MRAMLLGFALLLPAAPAQAQTADTRWSQWLGCWELTIEDVREGARTAVPLPPLQDSRPRICVTPGPDGGARFETTVAGNPAIDYTIVADGTDRMLTDTECRGTQRAGVVQRRPAVLRARGAHLCRRYRAAPRVRTRDDRPQRHVAGRAGRHDRRA